jgi:hypothetical protein
MLNCIDVPFIASKCKTQELHATVTLLPTRHKYSSFLKLNASFRKSAMSQIIRYLSLIVFLLNNRSNSSATILRMENLTPQESSMHTTGSNVTSFATLTGKLLTGYLAAIEYTDAKCSAVQYCESYSLNVCFPWINGYSFYMTSNGTHFAGKFYSDYSCAILMRSFITKQPLRACDQYYTSVSVTDSYPTIVSSAALLTAS